MNESDPIVAEMVNMLATELAERVAKVGTEPAALAELSQTLLGEMQVPLSEPAKKEFARAMEGMARMPLGQVRAHVAAQLTPRNSPTLFAEVFPAP